MNDYTNLRAAAAGNGAVLINGANKGLVLVDSANLAELLAEVDQLRGAVQQPKLPKKSIVNKVAAPGEGYPVWLPLDAWNAFLEMRKKIKKPATEYAQKLLLKKLTAFYANDLDPGVILNQSIMNSWQDLYAPKEPSTAARGQFAQRAPVAEQNRANNAEALRLLGQPMFADDDMTIEAMP